MSKKTNISNAINITKPKQLQAFSLIELVFVIAVIGILAAIAIPKLNVTRSDATYVAISSDIKNIISAIQVATLSSDISQSALNGDFIMQTAGLSASRWVAQNNGVRLAKNGMIDSANNCVMIDISQNQLIVEISAIPSSSICQRLLKDYPAQRRIDLTNTTF